MGKKNRLERRRAVAAGRKRRRPAAAVDVRGPDEECPRCTWIHDESAPCFDEEFCGYDEVPGVAYARAGLLAANGGVEVFESVPGADPGLAALAWAPGPLDPVRLAEELLRAGPDARLPDGARVGDVFPELFR